jgi:hypothetical protein
MKKFGSTIACLALALLATTAAWAETPNGNNNEPAVNNEPAAPAPQHRGEREMNEHVERILSALPKVSGYLQGGYWWADRNAGDRSTFQMKRMRLILDKKISRRFDFRAQFEVFSSSYDGTPYAKKVMTVMDAFVNAHVNKAINFRGGQFYLPLGFENYDISPATLELIDFSSITYRIVCRNPVSSPGQIDYGRDIGAMIYGDLLENVDRGFSYLSYNLSITNGNLPTLLDDNKTKDLVGRLTVRPIKNLRLTGSYNWGEYRGPNADGIVENYLPMSRYIAGVWYNDPNGLVVRSEWGRMESTRAMIREQGLYVMAGYRFGRWLPVARWDRYRDMNLAASPANRDNLLAGVSCDLTNSAKIQLNYIHSIPPDIVRAARVRTLSGNSVQLMCLLKF